MQLLCRVAKAKTVSNCVCSFPSRYNRIYTRTSPLLPSFVSRGSCLPKCRQLFRTGDISFAFCPVIAPKAGKALLSSHHICDKVRTDPANQTALIFFRSLRFSRSAQGFLSPPFGNPFWPGVPQEAWRTLSYASQLIAAGRSPRQSKLNLPLFTRFTSPWKTSPRSLCPPPKAGHLRILVEKYN